MNKYKICDRFWTSKFGYGFVVLWLLRLGWVGFAGLEFEMLFWSGFVPWVSWNGWDMVWWDMVWFDVAFSL